MIVTKIVLGLLSVLSSIKIETPEDSSVCSREVTLERSFVNTKDKQYPVEEKALVVGVKLYTDTNRCYVLTVSCPAVEGYSEAVTYMHNYCGQTESDTSKSKIGKFTDEAVKVGKVAVKSKCKYELEKLASFTCPVAAKRPQTIEQGIRNYVSLNYRCNAIRDGLREPHKNAVSEAKKVLFKFWKKPKVISWAKPFYHYKPVHYDSPKLYKGVTSQGGRNDEMYVSSRNDYSMTRKIGNKKQTTVKHMFNSQIGDYDLDDRLRRIRPPSQFNTEAGYFGLFFDKHGFPLNPCGRTGITGRGSFYQWGPQFAVDPIITKTVEGKVLVLVIERKEKTEKGEPFIAVPGGILDRVKKTGIAESAEGAGARELYEETSIDIDVFADDKKLIYSGYADDIRNTDNAWMETTVFWRHIEPDHSLFPVTNSGSHSDIENKVKDAKMRMALAKNLFDSFSKNGKNFFARETEGVDCFILHRNRNAANDLKAINLIEELYADKNGLFKNKKLGCKEIGRILGVDVQKNEEVDRLRGLISSVTGREKTEINKTILTKLKDTLVYYTKEKDMHTNDAEEGITRRFWAELQSLLDSDRMFASHRYFFERIAGLMEKEPTRFPGVTLPKKETNVERLVKLYNH